MRINKPKFWDQKISLFSLTLLPCTETNLPRLRRLAAKYRESQAVFGTSEFLSNPAARPTGFGKFKPKILLLSLIHI